MLIWPTSHILGSTVFFWLSHLLSSFYCDTKNYSLDPGNCIYVHKTSVWHNLQYCNIICSLGIFQIGTKTLIAFAILSLQFYSCMGLPLYRCHSGLNYYNPLFKRVKFSKYTKTKRTLVIKRANLVCYHFGLVVTITALNGGHTNKPLGDYHFPYLPALYPCNLKCKLFWG